MVHKILKDIVPYKHVRFIQTPDEDYAVYFSDKDYSGADELIALTSENLRIELYTKKGNSSNIEKITQRLIDLDMAHTRYETVWLNNEQVYMTTYMIFDYYKIKTEED